MNFKKVKRAFLAPVRYEAMRELFISANRRLVKIEEQLKIAQNKLLQKGVDEHFLEEEVEELKERNNALKAEVERLKDNNVSTSQDIFVVLYDFFDTIAIEYIGLDKEKAEGVFSQSKLFDFYQYRDEKVISKQTHREQGSSIIKPKVEDK